MKMQAGFPRRRTSGYSSRTADAGTSTQSQVLSVTITVYFQDAELARVTEGLGEEVQ